MLRSLTIANSSNMHQLRSSPESITLDFASCNKICCLLSKYKFLFEIDLVSMNYCVLEVFQCGFLLDYCMFIGQLSCGVCEKL